MRGRSRGLVATVGAVALFFALSSAAFADGPKPTVESWSASNIAATDATLEALVNPGTGEDGFALETTYEFFLESPWCGTYGSGFCEASGGKLVYKGTIPGGATAPQLERIDLAGVGQELSPDTAYGYRVVARNEVGEGFGYEKSFTTLPEGKAPVMESVSVSHITKTDATLEATIDTEGLTTEYAFHMISSPCSKKGSGCELIVPIALPKGGELFGSFAPQTVSLDLNSARVVLGEGEYVFGVTARSRGGEATKSGGVFEALEEPVVEPLKSTVTPGPVSDEPQVPLAGDRQPQSGGGSPAPVSGQAQLAGASSKPAHGKPSAKHGKRRKHEHHGKRLAKGHNKHNKH